MRRNICLTATAIRVRCAIGICTTVGVCTAVGVCAAVCVAGFWVRITCAPGGVLGGGVLGVLRVIASGGPAKSLAFRKANSKQFGFWIERPDLSFLT